MFSSIHIQNFKSVLDQHIELGRFNVFIGTNGSGKTNVLEAMAMAAAAAAGRLTTEDLFNIGMRVARASLMTSAFAGELGSAEVKVTLHVEPSQSFALALAAGHGGGWRLTTESADGLAWSRKGDAFTRFVGHDLERLRNFAIFAPSTQALRGLSVTSRREPLGVYGENLDLAVSGMSQRHLERMRELVGMIDWLDAFHLDYTDDPRAAGLKIGRSQSRLYFTDRFLDERNRTFSAENANEGVLHVMFHLALFLAPGTPTVFAVDNLETALNPGMCRALTKALAALATERGKQALVTTHNPAVLDGLNLADENQRLFVVSRNDAGHTVVRRVRTKPKTEPRMKLSELWLRGHLGALPEGF